MVDTYLSVRWRQISEENKLKTSRAKTEFLELWCKNEIRKTGRDRYVRLAGRFRQIQVFGISAQENGEVVVVVGLDVTG